MCSLGMVLCYWLYHPATSKCRKQNERIGCEIQGVEVEHDNPDVHICVMLRIVSNNMCRP